MARRKRAKKGSVHPILRSAYGNRARNLKDTILSLLPPSPQSCHCDSTGCLRCRGADHLLCQGDSTTYRHLISYAQCALSSDAPAPPAVYSVPQRSQRQIVRNTMELMKRNRSSNSNLLCKSYDMDTGTSLSVELLSSSDWSLLLDRIGDLLMEYLLRHCSIFVPNGRSINGFIQVTGTPLTSLNMSKPSYRLSRVSEPPQSGCTQILSHKCRRVGQVNSKAQLRRKRDEVTKDVSSQSSVCQPHKRKRLHSWQRRKQHKLNNQNKASSQHVKGKDCRACFRCFMSHSVKNQPADVLIKREYVFYNRGSYLTLFPKKHILNRLKPNECDAFSLIKKIFGNDKDYNIVQCTHCGHHAQSRSKCLYHSSLALFKSLIRDAQRCRHRMLLRKHCYVNFLSKDGQLGPKVEERTLSTFKMHQNKNETKFCIGNKDQTFETSHENSKSNASPFSPQSFSKHQQVVSFIFATLRRIVPLPLLGNKKSWRVLRRNIYKFVHMRRHEKFYLKDCLEGLEVSNFEFFSNLEKSCSCDDGGKQIVLGQKLLSTWVHWLFLHVVVPIISSNFYATEKESKRYEVFYYKKLIWGSVVKGCIEELKMKSFCPVDSDSVRILFNDSRCFGFSRFRFLPKENCLRPLANLNKPSRLPVLNKRYQSVNSSLNELHVILKTIKVQNPNLLGSSVFDYNDVYEKLHGFISKVKDGTVSMPEVFIVVADVSKAFDSIDQDKLLKIMEGRIMQNDEYIVGNYKQVLSRKNFVSPVYNASLGSIIWHNEGSCESNTVVQFSSSSGLFVAQAAHKKKKKYDLHRLLTEHVKKNIVKIGHDLYLQKVGIAQGSIISSLLCSFYLGHLEETLLQPYLGKLEETGNGQAQQSLLMRYLDDFIFVSTSKQQALGFFERLRRGFREYNCYMNCKKFGLNFEVEMGNFTNKRYIGEDGIPFLPWSGLLVNCITLEIQADYTRYWDIDISSTITVHKSNNPGDLLRSKLFSYMLPKSYVILYDSTINSPGTVRLNAYQAFLLCAMKFHCYICEMHCSVPSPDQLLKIIKKTCRSMYNLIFKRVRDAETCFGICAVLRLKMNEIIWLGLFAFYRILKKKQSRHKDLLLLLRKNIEKHDILSRTSYHLQYAVDSSHSSMFWKIKY
ncbi:telomerase reverse transcriptase-like [Carex rostrata]